MDFCYIYFHVRQFELSLGTRSVEDTRRCPKEKYVPYIFCIAFIRINADEM